MTPTLIGVRHVLLAMCCFVASAAYADIYCSPSAPLAFKGEPVGLSAWSDEGPLRGATWTVSTGKVESKDERTVWILGQAKPGRYQATVSAKDAGGTSQTCKVVVFYQTEPVFRGNKVREAGQSLILKGASEPAGYGLYTYLLFGEPLDEHNTPRAKKTLEAYTSLVVPLEEMEAYFDRGELNLVALPVTISARPKKRLTVDELVKTYDFARARSLLSRIDPALRRGPYLVSSLTPLGGKGLSDPYLLQDLSNVPPDVVAFWVRHFLNQAAQQHSWDAVTLQGVLLRTRTMIAVAAQALPDVTKGLDAYLKLVKQGG